MDQDQENRAFVSNPSKNPPQSHGIDRNYVNVHHDGSIVYTTTDEDDSTPTTNIDPAYDSEIEPYPPGFRFKPKDVELIIDYLQKKVLDQQLPPSGIVDVDLYKYNPQDLAAMYPPCGENEWYFFTSRVRKYPNGERPNRAAGDGYWKATGADRPIKRKGVKVGSRKALVFYMGKAPHGKKSDWIMHEFRVLDAPKPLGEDKKMMLDNWVLCRIYNKKSERFSSRFSTRRQSDEVQTDSPKSSYPNTPTAANSIQIGTTTTTTPQMINQMIPIQTQMMTPAPQMLNNARFAQQFGSHTHMLTALPTPTTQQYNEMDGGGGDLYNQNQIGYQSDFGNIFQSNELVSLPDSFIQPYNPQLSFIGPDDRDVNSFISNEGYDVVDCDNDIEGFGFGDTLMDPGFSDSTAKPRQFDPRQG
ncbi:NAC domain-containing protein 2-like [Tripterygium wilfordii]|uniref:NAC domain-containing protein 2-like n=1 Tax=Tripterygium wilfordii TaxID=458696 RepID=UPI0018F806CD|nr:NAC domain-containing protein 2-like [Tripterygium wilfordii]